MKSCHLCLVSVLAFWSIVACADTKRFILDVPDAGGGGGSAGNAGAGGMSGSGGSGGGGTGGMMAGAGGNAGSGLPDSGPLLDAGSDAGDASADASL